MMGSSWSSGWLLFCLKGWGDRGKAYNRNRYL
jgi:hypothetical protein